MAKKPTFDQVYRCLQKHRLARVRSGRGTDYDVYPEHRRGGPAIVGYPRIGQVVVHEDCWGDNTTCQGTRAGGIFNGNPSIYDWYAKNCGKP